MRKISLTFVLAILFLSSSFGQAPKSYSSSDIQLMLEKLNVLGNALYVAAHPDDENTRMITYLANDRKVNTAYLSMTRGDGGQNIIGPEIRELLGLIRTQELLAARRIDGGHQYFTRTIDFGYSKTSKETLEIWDEELALYDVVWIFRKWRPDVIITRFPPDRRAGHGQHASSAILAQKAFDLANDPTIFPEQLQYVDTWQPKRLFLNTGRWWRDKISADSAGVSTVDIGIYSKLLGRSYSEIAAQSRSQHRSQNFGVVSSRGEQLEYLESVKGSAAETDLFEGIDLTWTRVKGGAKIQEKVKQIIDDYQSSDPSASIPSLIALKKDITRLKDAYWRDKKLAEIDGIIKACLGLFTQARVSQFSATPGEQVDFTFEVVNRSAVNAKITAVSANTIEADSVLDHQLGDNERLIFKLTRDLPSSMAYTNPYWLEEDHDMGMYTVKDPLMIGKPENPPAIIFELVFNVLGEEFRYKTPVVYRWRDFIKGEMYRPFEITPPVFLDIENEVYVFTETKAKKINVKVEAGKDNVSGNLSINVPDGWSFSPQSHPFTIPEKGGQTSATFELTPPAGETTANISAVANIDSREYQKGVIRIEYDHIPLQTVFPKASSKAVKINLKTNGNLVGYIEGAGDDVARSLQQIGYEVRILQEDDINPQNLEQFDAVVIGTMAFNVHGFIDNVSQHLLDYVEKGGNLIIQYNKSRLGYKSKLLAPYPLELNRSSARSRVSDENAEIRILKPDHPAMQFPNKITSSDFEGWVQERGLYFPQTWDEKYDALFSSNDPEEDPLDGGLLVTKFGKGYYVYTGYAWFRQLPAGVPGAIRIFANLLSLGHNNQTEKKASLND